MSRIIFGVFEMMNPSNGMPTWTHPEGRGDDWDQLDYWVGLAKELDQAGFDFLFFADTYGYATLDGRMPEEVAAHGIQFPALDPMLAIATLAHETENLGFVVTSPTTVERPYALARRFATLDRFTGGRIGWNIVTGSSQKTTDDLFGVTETLTHDQRYDAADDFLDTCLRFWEHSWDDDAEVRDRKTGMYADPAKLHRIEVDGTYQRSHGIFAVPPTPQRTPVLFQAGTSDRGRAYAARNAEAVFIQGQTIAGAAGHVADIRAQAELQGRDAADVKVVTGMTVTVAQTEEEARAKRAEYEALLGIDDAAVMFAGITGIDLTGFDPETKLTDIKTDLGQTLVDRYAKKDPDVRVRAVLDQFRTKAIRGFQVTGTPEQVADEIEAIVDGSGIDGIMLEPTFGGPAAYRDFIELVLPILAARGRAESSVGSPTLRERFSGAPRLSPTHRAHRLSASAQETGVLA
ncbi:FMN-dependent oxidoreductase (nitrilotriacetate monooxygenase family) [Microbacterium halimionae]|uniref:FMN-dependent oxidoreductase (Nitrilotriacetate monooxygenase family) n=1 Tax=Microbacterium halimionae TaxID=1526413 RepID=A0A7W3JRI4_9MICO|nr:NtaA/DmoA family FMN-dependent monooxygenase [Microbacterium halimionae]MBA8817563.1 FMN-dependent oxidoreductase (nitrilotriacetate monooxygenase family) [Microbacterium halimionae]NII94273.1 FMN-dependent oxidoreductase (nitrilotriacetate monooxygenase family) [Microbacterium halimionae]